MRGRGTGGSAPRNAPRSRGAHAGSGEDLPRDAPPEGPSDVDAPGGPSPPGAPELRWFEAYTRVLDEGSVIEDARPGTRFSCPCCHHHTLRTRGHFDTCPVCGWEDDGQDDHDADVVRGGPNGRLSLTAARQVYLRLGAVSERALRRVRPPWPAERGDGPVVTPADPLRP